LTEEQVELMLRFTKVFDQTYTRFLDLQKAEAQAREAQIELALERVRSQAMAMQKSSDLLDIVVTMRTEFTRLGHEAHYFWHMMWLPDKYEKAMTSGDGTKIGFVMELPRHIHGNIPLLTKWEKSNKPTVVYAMDVEEALDYVGKMISLGDFQHIDPQAPSNDDIRHIGGLTFIMARTTHGEIGFSLPGVVENPPKEDLEILVRFAGAFDIAHRRFLDLQKSEAQSREVEIELALEKVRSHSMGMQKSEELKDVIKIVNQQLTHLKIKLDHAGFVVDYTPKGDWHFWIADELDVPSKITHPYFESVWATQFNEAKEKDADIFVTQLNFEEKNKFYNELLSYIPGLPKASKDFYLSCPGLAATTVLFNNVSLYIENFSGTPYSEEENKILMRFGKVFQQTYTRFLDLQKAEAQAREARIEASLERVRSKTMAMHNSQDVGDTVATMFGEFVNLGIHTNRCGILIFSQQDTAEVWTAKSNNENKATLITGVLHLDAHNLLSLAYNAWADKKGEYQYDLMNEDLKSYYKAINKSAYYQIKFDIKSLPSKEFHSDFFFTDGAVFAFTNEPIIEDHKNIIKRFAAVFGQTYRRYLDLQKAEALAREAKIEAALERVRSRTMAMQRSEQLPETAEVLFQQFALLGGIPDRIGIGIVQENTEGIEWWVTDQLGSRVTRKFFTSAKQQTILKIFEAWQQKKESLIVDLIGSDLDEWIRFVKDDVKMPLDASRVKGRRIHHSAFFSQGLLLCSANDLLPQATFSLLIRFAKVFDQTYTRFLDLQKAESQAREGQIELGLERVRARAMAMQHSDELKDLIGTVYGELTKLNLSLDRCLIWIMNNEDLSTNLWMAGVEGIPVNFYVPYHGHPPYLAVLKGWKDRNSKWEFDLGGKIKKDWDKFVFSNTDMKYLPDLVKKGMQASEQIIMAGSFQHFGCLQTAGPVPLTEEQYEVLNRFAKVFDSTYTRFNDLQRAEASAREAQIETGLEKVRSRTLAMQKSDELADTSIVIFEQLINLGIEPNRLFIGIIKEETDSIEAWATNEDGTKIDNHFTLQPAKNVSVNKMYDGWKNKKTSTTIDIQGDELQDYFHYLADEMKIPFQGGLSQKRRVQTIAYFGQGLIGIASQEEQPAATTQLLERFAAVFNLTYTRFNDLKIAEAHAIQAEQDLVEITNAKQSAEAALVELQATQRQLIQSEKMASLGELTAGIAHEIQNPLNFVNNFSEVSNELIDEVLEERRKDQGTRDEELEAELLSDIKQNLQKINHHGQRASSIVKGMLEHSRASTGKKEPTDINALCDEYLRLAYHGLRAKDKSFNATMHTDFDASIGKINVIPQDIGRVILNIITNAFYAVNERSKSGVEGYEPKITISTLSSNTPTSQHANTLTITISDNGLGIPNHIKDKIFQPFFTTKPTGQGTGLGLSLSYDIVKAHGGELKVKIPSTGEFDEKRDGTIFTIMLPI
jgi:signal transduction histidine kinase